MNEELILKLVKNKIVNNTITYEDFDKTFEMLSHKEQYKICDILNKNGIDLVDFYENVQNNGIIDEELVDDELLDGELLNDEDIDLFKDSVDLNYSIFNDEDVKQSNEILCILIQQGNNQAKQDLCSKNKLLVAKYANRYKGLFGSMISFEDLIQEGYVGLLKAAEKFDPSFGTAFTTYAVFWIKQSILRAIMDFGFMIRVPVHMMERIMKITKLDNTYEMEGFDCDKRMIKISKDLDISIEDVKKAISYSYTYLKLSSLDVPIGEERETILLDFVEDEGVMSPDDYAVNELLKDELNEVLLELTDREEKVLRLRFGLDDGCTRTLEEIGKEFNVTRERIRQIEAKALRRLKHPSRSNRLKDFLEGIINDK